MRKMSYLARVIDDRVESRLKSSGAVVIEGPRGCGKTSAGKYAYTREDGVSVVPLGALRP